jgi:hypothetical protein
MIILLYTILTLLQAVRDRNPDKIVDPIGTAQQQQQHNSTSFVPTEHHERLRYLEDFDRCARCCCLGD